MLRVRELETAELLTKQLPEVQVHSMTLVSGVTDTSDTTLDVDFTSTNQDRINVVDAPMLVPADPAMPQDVRQVAEGMLHKYSTADQWWVGADPLAGSPKAEASRPVPPPKRGPLGKLVAALLAFAFWLLGMLGNILFEWCVDVVVWPEDGPAHGDGRGRTARAGGEFRRGHLHPPPGAVCA